MVTMAELADREVTLARARARERLKDLGDEHIKTAWLLQQQGHYADAAKILGYAQSCANNLADNTEPSMSYVLLSEAGAPAIIRELRKLAAEGDEEARAALKLPRKERAAAPEKAKARA